jgi:hypothetical protein
MVLAIKLIVVLAATMVVFATGQRLKIDGGNVEMRLMAGADIPRQPGIKPP